jgi:hypothetical protein
MPKLPAGKGINQFWIDVTGIPQYHQYQKLLGSILQLLSGNDHLNVASGAIGKAPENNKMSASTLENFRVMLDYRHTRNSGRDVLSNISNMLKTPTCHHS